MFVLDTNHLRELALGTPLGVRLQDRIERTSTVVVTTIVCAEEVERGWLQRISTADRPQDAQTAYAQFGESVYFLARWVLLPWDLQAHGRMTAFRKHGVRIGTMDLKIACITLEHDATLLTRNRGDFEKVPGLRFENWLDS